MTDEFKDLPKIKNLDIHVETSLSQERVDNLCGFIFENCKKAIHDLLENAKLPLHESRDYQLADPNYKITEYLRDLEQKEQIESLSYLDVIDVLYELDRRIRKTVGVEEFPIMGEPIAASPAGPYPDLIDLPVYSSNGLKPRVTQKDADEYCQRAYDFFVKEYPELLFAHCEFKRRSLRYGEVTYAFDNILKDNIKSTVADPFLGLKTEFKRRLMETMSATKELKNIIKESVQKK